MLMSLRICVKSRRQLWMRKWRWGHLGWRKGKFGSHRSRIGRVRITVEGRGLRRGKRGNLTGGRR